jgi:hypothetical protein
MAAIKRRRRRRKKNPTTAQKVVLGVGATVGLGLIGYGGYLIWKNKQLSQAEKDAGAAIFGEHGELGKT